MKKLAKIRKIIDYLKSGIWEENTAEVTPHRAGVIKYLKISLMTFISFSDQKVSYRAVSLAYFSLMALVPFVALAFAVTQGFGIGSKLEELLLLNFSDRADIVKQILQYANNVVQITNQGAFGVVNFLCFIWLVFWMLIQVEEAFNYIWETTQSRNILQRAGTYLIITFLLPFVLVMFLSTTLLFTQGNGIVGSLISIPFLDEISEWFAWGALYIVVVGVLTLMYKFIPSAKVSIKKAFRASLIVAVAFCLFQWIYVEGQISFSRLNGVFGAVAAIPFLMIWLNWSWYIILFGAELTYAFHNVDSFNPHLDT